MSAPDDPKAGVKTLAVRLKGAVHAQLALIANLRGSTITDEINAALDAHIAAAKDAHDLANRADEALADIERDAAARRDAIAALFGTTPPTTATKSPARGRKATDGPAT